MTPPFRRRRLLDRSLAAGLAVVAAVVGLLVYRASDIRNADLVTGPSVAVPATPSVLPTRLVQKWSAPTNRTLGAVASASGVVVTTDQHTITAHDAVTGAVRWTYARSNRTLCAVGSGDIGPTDMSSSSLVPGITTVYDENGFCSQVSTSNPVTGARGKVRTSPNEENGSLVFGGPYAGWLGPNRLEVWRFDLVRTIEYGVQINPPKPGQSRTGCTFTDMALAANQFATIEHCAGRPDAQLVLNFDDPGSVTDHPDGWDVFQHNIRVQIDTKAAAARIVGVSADRVAVLVSGPTPAVDVYDAAGHRTSHKTVDIPAADIIAADSVSRPAAVTPAVQTPGGQRFSLVGDHLLAVSTSSVDVTPPATSFSTSTTTSRASITNALNPSTTKTVSVADLTLDWTAGGALGLPGTIDSTVLLPTAKGLSTFDSSTGPIDLDASSAAIIPLDRGGYAGRVDVTAIGKMIIEVRGGSVVALG